jgi:hypothetical protein
MNNEDFPPLPRPAPYNNSSSSRLVARWTRIISYVVRNGKPRLAENNPDCKPWLNGCNNCAQYGCSTMGFGWDGKCVKCGFPEEKLRSEIQQLNFDLMVIWIKLRWNCDNPRLCAEFKEKWKSVRKKIKAHNRAIYAANAWNKSQ